MTLLALMASPPSHNAQCTIIYTSFPLSDGGILKTSGNRFVARYGVGFISNFITLRLLRVKVVCDCGLFRSYFVADSLIAFFFLLAIDILAFFNISFYHH